MTYPHEEPEFHKPNDLPDYLQPEHIKRVMEVNNAVMEVSLNCKKENADCLECGKAECFEAFKAQAELWETTFPEFMRSRKRQRELDRKAAEEQTKRFAEYQRRFEELQNRKSVEKFKESDKQMGLFEIEKAA